MSNAIAAVGTLLQRWDSSGSSWDSIAEVTNISGPGMERDLIEVTSLDSTGGFKEFITGFKDGGEVAVTMNYTRAGLNAFKADFDSDESQNYQIVLPDEDNTSLEFQGLCKSLPLTLEVASQITMEVTLKVTGEVTINS